MSKMLSNVHSTRQWEAGGGSLFYPLVLGPNLPDNVLLPWLTNHPLILAQNFNINN